MVTCPRCGKKMRTMAEYYRHLGSKRIRKGDLYWTVYTGECQVR
jgi:uncharacterized C2H2 Zn-finger protein